jgi:hypothetical protein
MFGWIPVHVHVNKVAAQVQIMFHKVLVLQQDEEPLASSVGAMVPLELVRRHGQTECVTRCPRVLVGVS